ncbi:MAG TPA: thioesterase domain-containing protein [Ktedonobacteraceae bacterium]|nr:thioesterase domain-containing protein [Ktedonobacteraceae bacterium]
MATTSLVNPWLPYGPPKHAARLRLFCFHHAGGSASVFHPWLAKVHSAIEICPIQLPGRERRFLEKPISSLTTLLPLLEEALLPYLDGPFAFFGHSMGVLLCFELARSLRRQHGLEPEHLFLSAFAEVQEPRLPALHTLSDEQFIEQFQQRFQGLPAVVLEDQKALEYYLAILRADFTLTETYRYSVDQPFACPITALGGLQDRGVKRGSLAAWRQHTEKRFLLRMFPGGHNYLQSEPEAVLTYITQALLKAR